MTSIEWLASISGILGALLLAANIRGSGYGFLLFLISSLSWTYVAYETSQLALLTNQAVFVSINILGVQRWLLNRRKPFAELD